MKWVLHAVAHVAAALLAIRARHLFMRQPNDDARMTNIVDLCGVLLLRLEDMDKKWTDEIAVTFENNAGRAYTIRIKRGLDPEVVADTSKPVRSSASPFKASDSEDKIH